MTDENGTLLSKRTENAIMNASLTSSCDLVF